MGLREYARKILRRGAVELRADDELDGCEVLHRLPRDHRWTRDEDVELFLIPRGQEVDEDPDRWRTGHAV